MCGTCAGGYVILRGIRGPGISAAYACLCDAGRGRLASTAGVETVQSAAELDALYGGERPTISDSNWRAKLEAAGVPRAWAGFTLDSYRAKFSGDPIALRYVEYAGVWSRQSHSERSDLIFYGPNGTGKSGMAVSIAREVVMARQTVRCWSLRDLVTAWRDLFRLRMDGEAQPSEPAFVASLVGVDVLILDEIGGDKMTDFVEQTLTGIVDARQKVCRPTLLTLNIPKGPKDGDAAALSALLGPALMDRLRERGQFWPMVGASKRARFTRSA